MSPAFRWKTMLKSAMKYGKNEVITRLDIPFINEKVMNIPIWDLLFITLLNILSDIVTSSMQVSLLRRMLENLFLLCTIVKGMIIIHFISFQRLWAVKALAVGNYRLSFGQGLVMQDYLMGKTIYASSFNTRSGGIRKHSSTDEYNYFRGGCNCCFDKTMDILFSIHRIWTVC